MTIVIRKMKSEDLEIISDIERRSYEFPWSHTIFQDCLVGGYCSLVLLKNDIVVGYGILSIIQDEAHILNLCIDPNFRYLGYGEKILNKIIEKARDSDVIKIFLEVRPSNSAAISLYEKKGFFKIAYRPNYYKNIQGREDAEVLCLSLKNPY